MICVRPMECATPEKCPASCRNTPPAGRETSWLFIGCEMKQTMKRTILGAVQLSDNWNMSGFARDAREVIYSACTTAVSNTWSPALVAKIKEIGCFSTRALASMSF